ncbi:MAG: YfhO family protein [Dehalococcoidia bacterium]|nr:YfhO family protein [Dehalococcoidia bacterium]
MTKEAERPGLLPFLAVTVPILVYFIPLIIKSEAPIDFGGDLAFYFYPLTAVGMAQWQAGHAPLWTAGIQSGFPLLADGQGGLLYPLNLLVYWLLAVPLALKVTLLLQTLGSGILMYSLARELNLLAWPAVLSSWIWVAVVIFGSQSSPLLNALAWWPLLAWLALRLGSRQIITIYVPLVGLITGLMWLGGFPQTALYGVILASAFLLYAAFLTSGLRARAFWRSGGGWVLGLVLGIGLAAIQLVPTMEMAAESVRSAGLDYSLATQGSLLPTGLLNYLTPGWSVEGGLSGRIYIGILALSLALLRLRRRMSQLDKFLWVVCGLSLLLAFGKYTPLYYFVSKLPGLSFLRVPLRFTFLTTFCLSLLAGRGFSQLMAAFSSPVIGARTTDPEQFCRGGAPVPAPSPTVGQSTLQIALLRKTIRLLVLALLTISLVGGVVAQLGRSLFLGMARDLVQGSLLGTRYRLQGWDYYDAKINSIYSQITHSLSPLNPATLQPIVICLLALLAIRYATSARSSIPVVWLPTILLVLMGLEMALMVGSPFDRLSSANLLAEPPLVAQWQRQAQNSLTVSSRLYELVTQEEVMTSASSFASLTPNYNLLFGVPHTGASSALGSLRYFDFLGALGGVNLAYGLPPSSPEALRQNLGVLNLLGARFIAASKPLDDPRLTAITSDKPYVYLNPGALPRVYIVPKALTAAPEEALALVRSPAFAPLATVVLETEVATEFRPDSQIALAEIVEAGDETVRIKTQGAGWLVLTDLYYPGWRATIDGVETPIYRADAVFRTIAITDPGEHDVIFNYEPASFKYGVWLSIFSLLLIVVCFLLIIGRRDNGPLHVKLPLPVE